MGEIWKSGGICRGVQSQMRTMVLEYESQHFIHFFSHVGINRQYMEHMGSYGYDINVKYK